MNYLRKHLLMVATLTLVTAGAFGWLLSREDPNQVFHDSLTELDRGNLAAALDGITTLESHSGFESHVALLRGGYQLQRGHPSDALRSLETVEPVGALKEPALELIGECFFLLDQLPLAASQFQELLKDNPGSADAHRWLGQIFYNLGAFDTAVSHLQELIKLEPDNYLAHALIGHMAFDFEDFQVAVENYRKALTLQRPSSTPESVHQEVLRNLARSLIGQNNYPAALETLGTADTDHALVLALKADCHRGLGNEPLARKLLDQALKQDADERVAVLLQVDMAVDKKQTAAIVAPLERILANDPHDTACRYQLAQAWQRLGKPAKYKSEMARHDKSRELKQELTEKNLQANRVPDDAEVRDRLAELCEALGKQDLARMWKQAAAACRRLPQPQGRPRPVAR